MFRFRIIHDNNISYYGGFWGHPKLHFYILKSTFESKNF